MEFTLIEIVGFFAYLTNVAGNLLLARKNIWAWPVRMVSIVAWGIYAWDIASLSLLANAVTFFGINCYGLYYWLKDRKKKPDPDERVIITRFRDVDRDGPRPKEDR